MEQTRQAEGGNEQRAQNTGARVSNPAGYLAFVDIFNEAAREDLCSGKGPLPLSRELPALEWVERMVLAGADFSGEAKVWLATISAPDGQALDVERPVPPLAYAVCHNLERVARALIAAGADARWSFDMDGSGEARSRVAIIDLSQGWSDHSWRGQFCQGAVQAEIDRLEIEGQFGQGQAPGEAPGAQRARRPGL